jgi:hypothetical protein
MSYFYKLNFPVEFLKKEIDLSEYSNSSRRIFTVNTAKFVNSEAICLLESIGLTPSAHSYLFLRKPNESSVIHTDHFGSHIKRIWAINYTWGTTNSDMAWYKPLNLDQKKSVLVTTAGSDYTHYQDDEVQEIERRVVSGLFLTRTDVPHAATNYDLTNDRWSISVRILDVLCDWDRAIKILDSFIEQ